MLYLQALARKMTQTQKTERKSYSTEGACEMWLLINTVISELAFYISAPAEQKTPFTTWIPAAHS